jgi:nuclear pore complex protein Nup133
MITSTGGKCHLTSKAFTQPGPRSFSGLLPSFLTVASSMMDLKSYIRSISLGLLSSTGERDLWVLTEERVQKWVIKTDGWEEKKLDLGIADALQSAVQEFLGIRQEPEEWLQWSIELLDLAVEELRRPRKCF